MKKTILSIFAGFATMLTISAQIPNASFENWSSTDTYNIPEGWGTMNHTTASSSVFTATKGTPGNVGASYLKLVSKTVGTSVVNGIAVSGILDTITMEPKSGFAFTEQPVSISGKYQHMISGSSQGSIMALLTKWNEVSNKRDTIAIATQILSGMAMSWSNFSIDFTYSSNLAPDSCIIVLKASGSAPANGDYLYVDNLNFTLPTTNINNQISKIESVCIFPNPANETITIAMENAIGKTIQIDLIDITGRIILREVAELNSSNSCFSINTSAVRKGTYLLKIMDGYQTEYRKIIIEN